MRLAVRLAAASSLAAGLSGCATHAPAAPADQHPDALVVAEARSDVGNDRPQVSFDGLMVRRRTVVAVHVAAAGDLPAVRRHLEEAAARRHTTLSPISAGVLDPVPVERLAPDLALAFPAGATPADGRRVLAAALRGPGRNSTIRRHGVFSVLVHDLRFTVRAVHPTEVARAIAREGILADALGNYATDPGLESLDVLYTGPLLSDSLLRSVRVGMARAARVSPSTVAIAPRSLNGEGVHLADEPTPAPVEVSAAPDHHH